MQKHKPRNKPVYLCPVCKVTFEMHIRFPFYEKKTVILWYGWKSDESQMLVTRHTAKEGKNATRKTKGT